MTATREERRYFWERLVQILKEKNSPFTLKTRKERGSYRHDATAECGNTNYFIGVYIDKGLMRVGVYLNDLQYCRLIAHGGMEKSTGITRNAVLVGGTKNAEQKSLCLSYYFVPFNRESYERVILESFDEIVEFFISFDKFFANITDFVV